MANEKHAPVETQLTVKIKPSLKTLKSSISWESVEDDVDYQGAPEANHQYRLLTFTQGSSGQFLRDFPVHSHATLSDSAPSENLISIMYYL